MLLRAESTGPDKRPSLLPHEGELIVRSLSHQLPPRPGVVGGLWKGAARAAKRAVTASRRFQRFAATRQRKSFVVLNPTAEAEAEMASAAHRMSLVLDSFDDEHGGGRVMRLTRPDDPHTLLMDRFLTRSDADRARIHALRIPVKAADVDRVRALAAARDMQSQVSAGEVGEAGAEMRHVLVWETSSSFVPPPSLPVVESPTTSTSGAVQSPGTQPEDDPLLASGALGSGQGDGAQGAAAEATAAAMSPSGAPVNKEQGAAAHTSGGFGPPAPALSELASGRVCAGESGNLDEADEEGESESESDGEEEKYGSGGDGGGGGRGHSSSSILTTILGGAGSMLSPAKDMPYQQDQKGEGEGEGGDGGGGEGEAKSSGGSVLLPPPRGGGRSAFLRTVSLDTQALQADSQSAVSHATARPALTSEGSGGVYMLKQPDHNGICAVFKPADEEVGAEHNPRGYTMSDSGQGRDGFRAGEGAVREMAAYKLDRMNSVNDRRVSSSSAASDDSELTGSGGSHRGFAGIPPTTVQTLLLRTKSGNNLVEQSGSVQRFVSSEGSADDEDRYGFGGAKFSRRAACRIALQDVRLFNCDRHGGNMLVRPPRSKRAGEGNSGGDGAGEDEDEDGGLDLVPIDHAFTLPAFGFFREAEFEWKQWKHCELPIDDATRAYVASLDPVDDYNTALRVGLPESSCATLRCCTMLLKRCVECGMSPTEVGGMVSREWFREPTRFEFMVAEALGLSIPTEHTFNTHEGDLTLVNYVKGVVHLMDRSKGEKGSTEEEEEEEEGKRTGRSEDECDGRGGGGENNVDISVAARVTKHLGEVKDGWFVPNEEFFRRFADCLERELPLPQCGQSAQSAQGEAAEHPKHTSSMGGMPLTRSNART